MSLRRFVFSGLAYRENAPIATQVLRQKNCTTDKMIAISALLRWSKTMCSFQTDLDIQVSLSLGSVHCANIGMVCSRQVAGFRSHQVREPFCTVNDNCSQEFNQPTKRHTTEYADHFQNKTSFQRCFKTSFRTLQNGTEFTWLLILEALPLQYSKSRRTAVFLNLPKLSRSWTRKSRAVPAGKNPWVIILFWILGTPAWLSCYLSDMYVRVVFRKPGTPLFSRSIRTARSPLLLTEQLPHWAPTAESMQRKIWTL